MSKTPFSAPANRHAPFLTGALLAWVLAGAEGSAALHDTRVIADEIITTTTPAENGSSPMWCVGAPLLVREGGNVWASISVHDPDAPPACNTHWELWGRPATGAWARIRSGPAASEREPCPLFLPAPHQLMLSIHPKILERDRTAGGEQTWYCQPAIAQFDTEDISDEPKLVQPEFDGRPVFNQHTYRGVGVDRANGAFLLMSIDRFNNFHLTRREAAGSWRPLRAPEFPIRACYPTIVHRGGEAHVFAIGDIVEPVAEWKAEKARVLQRSWDYVFRRVFYAWSPDLANGGFREPLEIDTVESTAGWAFNLDMASDRNGRVHLLWVRQNIQFAFLRDRFFPGTSIVEELRHAVVEDGRVITSETLSSRKVDGGADGWHFTTGRFHELADGRLLAVLFANTSAPGQPDKRELLLQDLDPEARSSAPPVRVALERPPPAGWFFTNTTRGGSRPENNLDILTAETRDGVINLRYLHVLIPD